jgi:hypothetical protein
MSPLRLFVGHDPREAVGLHAFIQSVLQTTPVPVSITPLSGKTDGTNAFTLARFLVPSLCGFTGHAIWCDGADMLLRADLRELLDFQNWRYAAQVVQHSYTPKHDRKYIGTELEAPNEAYERKNWSSLILWNCEHDANMCLTQKFVEAQSGRFLHRFSWLEDGLIRGLPLEWNWLDEYGWNDSAKLVHYTNGIPGFSHYANAPHSEEWRAALRLSQRGLW